MWAEGTSVNLVAQFCGERQIDTTNSLRGAGSSGISAVAGPTLTL